MHFEWVMDEGERAVFWGEVKVVAAAVVKAAMLLLLTSGTSG